MNFDWSLKDTIFEKNKGKVFSCFSCAGGSAMGYKLAGYDVIGCNEIDKRVNDVYVANHNPKYNFVEPIQDFILRDKFPDELYKLDILDGSPPCSSFSMAGNREKDWGKEKKFREGQANQILDTLFFDFIHLGKRLQPKVIIAENVDGLLFGNAIDYVRKINNHFDDAGYYCQHFLLNSATMEVPQERKRVFFIALRKDLATKFLVNDGLFDVKPHIDMTFNFNLIPIETILESEVEEQTKLTKGEIKLFEFVKYGDTDLRYACERMRGKQSFFQHKIVYPGMVAPTVTTRGQNIIYDLKRHFSKKEVIKIGSFPYDFNFLNENVSYIIGMSVPPLMMKNVSLKVHDQWLSKL